MSVTRLLSRKVRPDRETRTHIFIHRQLPPQEGELEDADDAGENLDRRDMVTGRTAGTDHAEDDHDEDSAELPQVHLSAAARPRAGAGLTNLPPLLLQFFEDSLFLQSQHSRRDLGRVGRVWGREEGGWGGTK